MPKLIPTLYLGNHGLSQLDLLFLLPPNIKGWFGTAVLGNRAIQ
jgi:hypothetical protein